MSPPHSAHSPKFPCCIRSKAWVRVLSICPLYCSCELWIVFRTQRQPDLSRIGMSRRACSCLLLRRGEHTVQLRNTGFEKLLEVLGFLSCQHAMNLRKTAYLWYPESF